MSSGSKQPSRWGSFFQQAVAGVESRLDTILAEDDGSASTAKAKGPSSDQIGKLNPPSGPASARTSGELSRHSSTNRQSTDRLQERLAKAVGSRTATPKPTETGLSPAGSLTNTPASPRSSLESRSEAHSTKIEHNSKVLELQPAQVTGDSLEQQHGSQEPTITITQEPPEPKAPYGAAEYASSISSKQLLDDKEGGLDEEKEEEEQAGFEDMITLRRLDYEAAELRRQEEVHEYIERIDALQTKLQYLAKEAVESAKRATEEAPSGTVEEKMAQKDEKIALLVEEGQKLSQNELKLMTTLKKLRAKMSEDEKQSIQAKNAAEKSESARISLSEQLKTAESAHSEEAQRIKKLERDLERLRTEIDAKSSKISELQTKVTQAAAHSASDKLKEVTALLENERATTSQSQEELSTAKIEKKLAEDRHRAQTVELEESITREKEHTKAIDFELRGEIASLESRLETYRSQAEEISSGNGSDTQAKLFRQIETLQTQYSVASENWRGIESSLLARISTIEKERDEVSAKEADSRKRLRDAATKNRRTEDDLEQTRGRIYELDEKLTQQVTASKNLRSTLEQAQRETENVRGELAVAKDQIALLQREIEKRDAQATEAMYSPAHVLSPGLAGLKNATDRMSVDRGTSHGRRPHILTTMGAKDAERPSTGSRKASAPFGHSPFSSRNESQASVPLSSSKESAPSGTQSPSQLLEQQDDLFDGVGTPATPDKTINDMFSASTAAAGPSVQLVERMSAAVRRLEGEKAASREEIERVQGQRDEAREQVVSLMKETEEKRAVADRVASLELELEALNKRYQTTLEMLGEKSERVEELQADIADMKQIYRDVLEKTVR